MDAPRVNPVGVVEFPAGYRPRRLPPGLRLVAAGLLVAFVTVVAVTTGLSAGGYCLTSDTSRPSPLH